MREIIASTQVCNELVKFDLGWRVNIRSLYITTHATRKYQVHRQRTAMYSGHKKNTHRDEFEYFVDDEDRSTDIEHRFPFVPVERGDRK